MRRPTLVGFFSDSTVMPFLVVIKVWTSVDCGIVLRAFCENYHSAIATQMAFCLRSGIPRADFLPFAHNIMFRTWQSEETGTAGRAPGAQSTIRTIENVCLV